MKKILCFLIVFGLIQNSIIAQKKADIIPLSFYEGVKNLRVASMASVSSTSCQNTNPNNVFLVDVIIVPNGTIGVPDWSTLIVGNTYSGSIAAPSLGVITGTYTVKGSLTINDAVIFRYTNIAFDEGVVVYQNISNVKIDKSWWWGCNNLWTGIQSRGRLDVTNSFIEDAYFAINMGIYYPLLTNHSGLYVVNTVFNRNYAGIGVGFTAISNGNMGVWGNVFTCRDIPDSSHNFNSDRVFSRYLTPLSNYPTTTLKGASFAGIAAGTIRSNIAIGYVSVNSGTTNMSLGNVSAPFPAPNSDYANYIDNHNIGLFNSNSNVYAVNNYFSDIKTTTTGTAHGAVYHDDGLFGANNTRTILSAFPAPITYKNSFKDCDSGVVAINGGWLEVKQNDFENISGCVVRVSNWNAVTPNLEQVIIQGNNTKDVAYTYYGYDNKGINVTVLQNKDTTITGLNSDYYNVYAVENSKLSTIRYNIESNVFSGSLNGVFLKNITKGWVTANTITIKKPLPSIFNAALHLDGSDNAGIGENLLRCYPSNSKSLYTNGILTDSSIYSQYVCNTFSGFGSCLKFQGICNTSHISRNSFNVTGGLDSCIFGIFLDNNAIIENVGMAGSSWTPGDNIWGDFAYGLGGADTYCQNNSNLNSRTIEYDPSGPSYYKPQINKASSGSNPFSVSISADFGGSTCNLFANKKSDIDKNFPVNPVSDINIYPNPASNSINFSTAQSDFQNSQIEIINCLGQSVLKIGYKNQIDVSFLETGVYTLLYKDSKNQITQKRIVIAK